MSNLFKKVAVWTDIHLGLKNNSSIHNQDCIDFTKWAIKTAKENGCETCMFLGDFFNSRASINVRTLHHGIECIELMSKAFENTYIITGNHDLYYRDNREINSIEFGSKFPGVTLVDSIFTKGNVSIVPWLVGDDYKKVKELDSRYLFGHFEFPNFLMNAMVRMPETGSLQHSDLQKNEYVFSGHFHKRQQQKNIIYIGNCFPHNYSDVWDDDRGMMMFEWGGEPEFKAWPNAPKYRSIKLSQLLENPEFYLTSRVYMRVIMDIEINYEESNFIKETFMNDYDIRELVLIPNKDKVSLDIGGDAELSFESVDSIITRELTNIKSDFYDPDRLLSIYKAI